MTDIYQLMPQISDLIPYGYQHIKNPTYEALIAQYLGQFKSKKNPVFIQVGGIPGAGKTTFCQQLSGHLFLSFDQIMESIPAYQQDLYLLGNVKAFEKWEIPARVIGYEILCRAINKRFDIVLEHSGVNQAHLSLFKSLQKLGYTTNMYFISCPLSLALSRASEREQRTHRFTPPEMIKKRFDLVQKYVAEYKNIANHTYIYDSSSDKFVLKDCFVPQIAVGAL